MIYSIFLHPSEGTFEVERFRNWLKKRDDTLHDPLGSDTYMILGSLELVEFARDRRVEQPTQFPLSVLVTIKAEEINVFQEYGDDLKLRIAREFVKMIIDETGCKVLDEFGTDWTERVRQEGVGVLYPDTLT
jgi:hypothetical protein